MSNGGGLVIGSGDNVIGPDYNRILGSTGAKLLPFDLADVQNATETTPFKPAPESVDAPSFLTPFREPPYSNALDGVSMTKVFGVKDANTGGRVLVRTADSKPFITSRVFGEGEVIMVNTTMDEKWTNFPGRGSDAFVPFTSFTLAHLTGRKTPGGTKTAGDPLVWYPPEVEGGFELVKPPKQGEKDVRRVKLDKPEAKPGEKLAITATDTADPGIYRIVPDGKPDSAGPTFAVNADLRESANLEIAENKDLVKLLDFEPTVIQAGASTESAVNQIRVRQEWTEWVLVILLIALVVESAFAWFCGRAW